MRRNRNRPQHDLEEIAQKLRLLGCTEQQVRRHLAPRLNEQAGSRSSRKQQSYSDADEFTALKPIETGRDDEGLG